MSEYLKCFDETKYMSFLDKIWNRVSNLMKKEFDSGPVYYEKYLKTKIKSCDDDDDDDDNDDDDDDDEINTNFYNEMPNDGSHSVCLSVMLIDSVS